VRAVKRGASAVFLLLLLIYSGDYAAARLKGSGGLATVPVQPYYAVPLRSGKTEFMLLPPENRTCVHALFPHFGYAPCWYLSGKREQRINM
jgi:hypothetical protein